MATFTIAAAARLCRCDRRTLQRAIHAGRLHLAPQHCLSHEELIATGYLVPDMPHETPHGTPQDTPLLMLLEHLTTAITALCDEVHHLRQALRPPQATPRGLPQRAPRGVPQQTPQDTPQGAGSYDPGVALARMQALKTQDLSLAQIAATLTAEGIPTRSGKPWHKGTVGYLLQHGAARP
jgi:hypothetical protein